MQTHIHRGREYTALALFTGEDRAQQADEYIRTHLHVKVLCDDAEAGTVIVSDRDMGRPVDAPDSGFGTVGWVSLYEQR